MLTPLTHAKSIIANFSPVIIYVARFQVCHETERSGQEHDLGSKETAWLKWGANLFCRYGVARHFLTPMKELTIVLRIELVLSLEC